MPVCRMSRPPVLLDDAGATLLVGSYGAVSSDTQLRRIGHMPRFISFSPMRLVATADATGKQDMHKEGPWAPMS